MWTEVPTAQAVVFGRGGQLLFSTRTLHFEETRCPQHNRLPVASLASLAGSGEGV